MSFLSDRAIDAICVLSSELGEGSIHAFSRKYGGVFLSRYITVHGQTSYIAGHGPEEHEGATPRDALARLRDAVPELQEGNRVR